MPDPKLDLRDLTRFGDWQVTKVLGAGGFGAVLEAEKRQVDGQVLRAAVKVMRPDTMNDPDAMARFAHEFDVLRRLDSPYIPKVLDSGQQAVQTSAKQRIVVPWIATELVRGEDLGEEVRRHGVLDSHQWWELAHDIVAAAAATHQVGVVHLDIKPDNVMRFSRRSILVDFGGASYVAVVDPGDNGVFTLGYAAPEQIDGMHDPADFEYPVDLFAIGATLVFAASGLPPWDVPRFDGSRPQMQVARQSLVQAMRTTPPRLDGLEGDQAHLVRTMLSPDPRTRGQAVQALAFIRDHLPASSPRATGSVPSAPVRFVAGSSSQPPATPPPVARPAIAAARAALAAAAQPVPERSFVTTWVLSLLLGWVGADRFYLGKVPTALIKLVTFGGLGVWATVDLLLLAFGQTQDNQRRPVRASDGARMPIRIITLIAVGFWWLYVIVSGIARNAG